MSGLCGQASLPRNFKGNESLQILIRTIFTSFRKLSRPILFNFDKVAEQWYGSKFTSTGLNNGKLCPLGLFYFFLFLFYRRHKLWRSCDNEPAKPPWADSMILFSSVCSCYYYYFLFLQKTNFTALFSFWHEQPFSTVAFKARAL